MRSVSLARRYGRIVVAVLAGVAVGCTPPPVGDSRVPLAPGGEPSPNFAGYREADHPAFEYRPGIPWYSDYTFRTAGGQICSMSTYLDARYAHATCTGPRPDRGPGRWEVVASRPKAAAVRPLSEPDPDPPEFPEPPLLPARHTLTDGAADFVCGTDGADLLACRVGDHGFVLTSTSTRLF